jgi:hypothetical protein
MAKNPIEMQQGIPPLNHHCPIIFESGVSASESLYGLYVMGGYDLTHNQKKL